MLLEIKEITKKKEFKKFIQFPDSLYKGNPNYVPLIVDFELGTFLKNKNPAYEHCDAKFWMVYRGSEPVGRIGAVIHGMEVKERPIGRFGWIDFINNKAVFDLLIKTASTWLQSKGMKHIHGPMGFTDLDYEGTLISGYDQMATQATIYNHPYYLEHFERAGFEKACDWVEVRMKAPTEMPNRIPRMAEIVSKRSKIKVKEFKNTKEILKYGPGVFNVLNEAYSHLYGYYPLSNKQVEYYTKLYFGFIKKEFITIIVNEDDQVVGFGITLPSLSKAFQKAKGSLFPFGFIHILRAFNRNKHVDMFLIGVLPRYQKLGANSLIFNDILGNYIKKGIKYLSTGPMLEDNRNVLNIWNDYSDNIDEVNIRRRCFIKKI